MPVDKLPFSVDLDAIEKRLGRKPVLVALFLALVWFLVAASTAIYNGFIGPVARIVRGQIPQFPAPRVFATAIPLVILMLAALWVWRRLRALHARLNQLEQGATQKALVDSVSKRTSDAAQHTAYKSLVRLREDAIRDLLNRPVQTEQGLQELKAAIDQWQDSVSSLLVMAGASDVDISRFNVLGTFPRGLPGLNDEHRKEKDMLAERLRRLEQTIEVVHQEISRKAQAGLQQALKN
jgi:uncharacterized membrane protein YccC